MNIYRLLGLNGKNRSIRIKNFLYNCIKNGQKLVISKCTEIEFFESLKYSLKLISRMDYKKVYIELLEEDVIAYYYERKNTGEMISPKLFFHEISNKYDKYVKELKIIIEE